LAKSCNFGSLKRKKNPNYPIFFAKIVPSQTRMWQN